MSNLQLQFPNDTWVKATWEDYLQAIEDPRLEKAKCYYHDGQLRIEMSPIGHDHACDHTIIMLAVNLSCILKGIDFNIDIVIKMRSLPGATILAVRNQGVIALHSLISLLQLATSLICIATQPIC